MRQQLHHRQRKSLPLAMGYYRTPWPPHARQFLDNYLLIYCIGGKGTLMCGDRHYRIADGDLVPLPRHRPCLQGDTKNPGLLAALTVSCGSAHRHTQLSTPRLHIGVQPRMVRVLDGLTELRRSNHQLAEFIQGCHQLQALLSYVALLNRQQ